MRIEKIELNKILCKLEHIKNSDKIQNDKKDKINIAILLIKSISMEL